MVYVFFLFFSIIALRNEKGSYNTPNVTRCSSGIIALRNEKGSYNLEKIEDKLKSIIALRNEKGSYNYDERQNAEKRHYSTAK